MRAGALRTRVDWQRAATSRDTHGDEVTTWHTVQTLYAEMSAVSGRELLAAGAHVSGETLTRFRLRSVPGLRQKDRFTVDGVPYDLEAVLPSAEPGDLEVLGRASEVPA